jgi:hypothetical protein
MAVIYKAPGTYVLGGISAPSRGTGQAFRAGLTTAQQRREREQAMQLRASAEQRAKEQFEMAKADRARAAAQAARIQQAQAEFARNNRPTGLTIPDIASASAPPPAGMRLPAGPTAPSAVSPSLPSVDTTPPPPPAEVPLSMGMTPAGTAGGVQVAGLSGPEAFRMAFEANPELFGVQVADVSGTSIPPVGTTPLEEAINLIVANSTLSREDVQALLDQGVDLRYLLAQLPPGTVPSVDAQRVLGSPSGAAEAEIERITPRSTPIGTPLYEQLVSLLPPSPEVAGEETDVTQGPMVEAPAQPATPDVSTPPTQLTTPTIDVPPTGLSGVTMAPSAAEDVNAIAAQTGGDISEFYLRNPASIFTTADNAYRDIQRWEGLIRYYQQIGDLQGVVQAEIGLGQARQAFSDMSGQLALAGVQLDNYGPLQLHLQQVYPDGTVEVRPYTDNTVEIFVDGDSIRRDNKNDLLAALASAFNEEYRAGQAALSTQAAELRSLLLEQELETRGAIALESIQQQGRLDLKLLEAELARLENEGEVTLKRIDDPTGLQRPIFEYRAGDGPPRYITFREVRDAEGASLLQYDFVPLPGSE